MCSPAWDSRTHSSHFVMTRLCRAAQCAAQPGTEENLRHKTASSKKMRRSGKTALMCSFAWDPEDTSSGHLRSPTHGRRPSIADPRSSTHGRRLMIVDPWASTHGRRPMIADPGRQPNSSTMIVDPRSPIFDRRPMVFDLWAPTHGRRHMVVDSRSSTHGRRPMFIDLWSLTHDHRPMVADP